MVGIGGAFPFPGDLRLGDVAINKPNANASNGGIVQYDFGKHVKGGEYLQTGSLNAPPRLFLTALTTMQAKHQMLRISEHLFPIFRRSSLPEHFEYQGEENDQLFEAEYEHGGGGETCANCDLRKLVKRPFRIRRGIVIHYGTVASGNSVIKSGVMRDRLARDHEVKCFEMEAAGINAFPCLIIRGICDYSGTHKNNGNSIQRVMDFFFGELVLCFPAALRHSRKTLMLPLLYFLRHSPLNKLVNARIPGQAYRARSKMLVGYSRRNSTEQGGPRRWLCPVLGTSLHIDGKNA